MTTRNDRLEMVYKYAVSTKMCKNKKTFAELIGVRDSTLSKALGGDPKYLSDVFFIRVNSALDNVFNTDWLLTGNGEMLNGNNGSTGDSIHHNSAPVVTRGAHNVTIAADNKDKIIAQLQSQITTLQAQIDAQHEHADLLQSQIATLQSQIAELKADKQNLMQLLTNLTQNK